MIHLVEAFKKSINNGLVALGDCVLDIGHPRDCRVKRKEKVLQKCKSCRELLSSSAVCCMHCDKPVLDVMGNPPSRKSDYVGI